MPKNLTVLENAELRISVSNYGARLVSLDIKAKTGDWIPLCAGFSDLNDYEQPAFQYFGATVGPVAGRLAKGLFNLKESFLQLETNEGENYLHGGVDGAIHNKEWVVCKHSENRVQFEYSSLAGAGGFPGNMTFQADYLLTHSKLQITLSAITDSATPLSMTNHSYWNLSGDGSSASTHELRINAGSYIPIDQNLLPVGQAKLVNETSFDFRSRRLIGVLKSYRTEPEPGFDHTYLLDSTPTLREIAELSHPGSGVSMKVSSDSPALQLYTGNRNPAYSGSELISISHGNTICLEAFGVNNPELVGDYDSILVTPDKPFNRVVVHDFLA